MQGVGPAIGGGRNTKFWLHRWLDGKRLIDHALHAVPTTQLHCSVRDYWSPEKGWNWTDLSPIFQQISSFELAQEEIDDELVWGADISDQFSIKSALKIIRKEQDLPKDPMWRWTWTYKVP